MAEVSNVAAGGRNFNAKGLYDTIGIICGFGGNPPGNIGNLAGDCQVGSFVRPYARGLRDLSELVKSEDSNLAGTCQGLADTLDKIIDKMSEISTSLMAELSSYAESSIANELGATKSLNDINIELFSINTMLDSDL